MPAVWQTWGDATEWLSPLFPLWGAECPVCQGTGSIFSLAGDREKISTLEPLTDLPFCAGFGCCAVGEVVPAWESFVHWFGRTAGRKAVPVRAWRKLEAGHTLLDLRQRVQVPPPPFQPHATRRNRGRAAGRQGAPEGRGVEIFLEGGRRSAPAFPLPLQKNTTPFTP